MPNIMLSYRCNLQCSYCFANEFVNSENIDITTNNFNKALNFLTTSGNSNIGLIGGEPTIHPQFGEFLEILINNAQVKKVTIYTNGLILAKYIKHITNPKFFVLINCNSPLEIGQEKYNVFMDQVGEIITIPDAKKRVTFGINLFSNNLDYNYIIELLKKYDIHRVRMSVTVPNRKTEKALPSLEYLNARKRYILGFIKSCAENLILPYYDCNTIPLCIWSQEEMREIQEIVDAFGVKRTNLVGYHSYCEPVIDVLPDLNAVRCFGMSDFLKVPIDDFDNLDELRRYFLNMIDSYAYHIPSSGNCIDCKIRKIQQCMGGCLAFLQDALNNCSEVFNSPIKKSDL